MCPFTTCFEKSLAWIGPHGPSNSPLIGSHAPKTSTLLGGSGPSISQKFSSALPWQTAHMDRKLSNYSAHIHRETPPYSVEVDRVYLKSFSVHNHHKRLKWTEKCLFTRPTCTAKNHITRFKWTDFISNFFQFITITNGPNGPRNAYLLSPHAPKKTILLGGSGPILSQEFSSALSWQTAHMDRKLSRYSAD